MADQPRIRDDEYAHLRPDRPAVIRDTKAEGWPEWLGSNGAPMEMGAHRKRCGR